MLYRMAIYCLVVLRLPTPTLNSNTTYYVESENGSGRQSTRTSVSSYNRCCSSSPTVIGTVFAVDKRLCLHQVHHQVLVQLV
ncbi:MAG: hypothetical protein IPN93_17705 [Bacteroidetes bacterium]|nr:hypothetical protein [Bacteroidota bacterium]